MFFRKPGVSLSEAAVRSVWFGDPYLRLHWPGVLIQWSGLLCIIGAGLAILLQP
jgi:hypothetical protein